MEVIVRSGENNGAVDLERVFLSMVAGTTLAAVKSVICLLMTMGSLLKENEASGTEAEIMTRLPVVVKVKNKVEADNKDAGDSEDDNDDEEDDDEAGDDQDDDGGDDSGEDGNNNEEDDDNDDPEANGEAGSEEDDDDDDGDEDEDEDEDEDDEEEEEEEEEDEDEDTPPAKRRK